jgi:hypothetical protein
MYVLWSTQCPKCGILIVRAPQPASGAAFQFGQSWCGLCSEPLAEIVQRIGEVKDDVPPKPPKATKAAPASPGPGKEGAP